MKIAHTFRPATLSILICMLHLSLPSHGQEMMSSCGSLENHYGPYDYRTTTKKGLAIVESAHFTHKVESLAGGNTSITAGGDLNYTLHVFPNHHRALMAAIKLAEKEKKPVPRDMDYSVPCWFERAERFRPDDAMVKAIHGIYLIRSKNSEKGEEKLKEALELSGENANIHYNLGLAYIDLKDYTKALESAHRAYALGFPLPGLRNILQRLGKWHDAPAVIVNGQTARSPSENTSPK